jgi:hypothetical protein
VIVALMTSEQFISYIIARTSYFFNEKINLYVLYQQYELDYDFNSINSLIQVCSEKCCSTQDTLTEPTMLLLLLFNATACLAEM